MHVRSGPGVGISPVELTLRGGRHDLTGSHSMTSDDPGVRDDLGRELLASLHRADHRYQLDVTLSALTPDQLDRLAQDRARPETEPARARLIDNARDSGLIARLSSRWVLWADTFGIPFPALDAGRHGGWETPKTGSTHKMLGGNRLTSTT